MNNALNIKLSGGSWDVQMNGVADVTGRRETQTDGSIWSEPHAVGYATRAQSRARR